MRRARAPTFQTPPCVPTLQTPLARRRDPSPPRGLIQKSPPGGAPPARAAAGAAASRRRGPRRRGGAALGRLPALGRRLARGLCAPRLLGGSLLALRPAAEE